MYVNFLNENQNKAFTGIYQMVIDNIYLSNVFALGPVQAEVHLTYIEPFLRRIDLCNLMRKLYFPNPDGNFGFSEKQISDVLWLSI